MMETLRLGSKLGTQYGVLPRIETPLIASSKADIVRLAVDLGAPLVLLTGGEPMLQVDASLVHALKAAGFEIAIETNGTLPVAEGIDWICVSPKAGTDVVQRNGHGRKNPYFFRIARESSPATQSRKALAAS